MLKTILKLLIVLGIGYLAFSVQKLYAQAPDLPPEAVTPTFSETLADLAKQNDVSLALLKAVMRCESGGNQSVIGDNGRAVGIFQYHKGTFESFAKEMGDTSLKRESEFDQATVTAWAFAQGETYRRHWTTYRAIKNGGTYTFYSKQAQRTYVVKCKVEPIDAS